MSPIYLFLYTCGIIVGILLIKYRKYFAKMRANSQKNMLGIKYSDKDMIQAERVAVIVGVAFILAMAYNLYLELQR